MANQQQSLRSKWLTGTAESFKANFAFELGTRTLLGGENPLSPETLAGAAVNTALMTALGPFGMPLMMAQPLAMAAQAIGTAGARARADWGRATQTTQINQQAAYTMRQRAIQAIQGSKMNARSALGNEASLLHR